MPFAFSGLKKRFFQIKSESKNNFQITECLSSFDKLRGLIQDEMVGLPDLQKMAARGVYVGEFCNANRISVILDEA